jgi:hypothetical protein
MRAQHLFVSGQLREHLGRARERAMETLLSYPADQILQASEADVIAYVLGRALVEEVILHRDGAELLEPSEHTVSTRDTFDLALGQQKMRVTRWTLVVPFAGDGALLRLQASSWTTSQPYADMRSNEIRLSWDSRFGSGEPQQIKAYFDGELDRVDRHLEFTNNDVRNHNKAMEAEFPAAVRARRDKHLADKQTQAALGFPVRRRADADTYSAPVTRRRIRPERKPQHRPGATGRSFAPEPVLIDTDYEEALRVLISSRNALERNPSTIAKLNEEEIRNLLLISLNTQFEGNVGGEVFNGAGKTDILVRVDDRNVFIGECKIWKGPKTVGDALDQLLTYLVWRDTKAALLIFVKSGDITAITDKSVAAVAAHPNYKRVGRHADEDRHDFVLHANSDPDREIQLALLIFPLMANKADSSTS